MGFIGLSSSQFNVTSLVAASCCGETVSGISSTSSSSSRSSCNHSWCSAKEGPFAFNSFSCFRLRSHKHEYESGTVRVPGMSSGKHEFACISMAVAAVHIYTSMRYM